MSRLTCKAPLTPCKLLAFMLVVLAAQACLAQPGTLFQWSYGEGGDGGPDLTEPLVTDRPDFTEAPSTVGRGVVQLESGYTYTYDSEPTGGKKVHSFPEALFRVGMLAEWMEFRIFYNYAEETTTSIATGNEDLGLGVKFALTGQEGILPEMGIIFQMTVPSGSSAFTADETLPGVNWIYGWELTDRISTAGQTQANRALDDLTSEPYLEFSQSWTIGASITERVGTYAEWFVLAPDGADSNPTENYFNGGLTFLVTENLQFDVRSGVGLNDAADNFFTGAGFSIRR